ncbi:aldehyde dehydrogenase [Stappia stellulata]|uniref:aldehyde dehydrogenase n=1 Tax=Stappia stellulata TaxID=71235 RepID=UPI000428D3ED|nr:aldehyde dehydrogenase [Stappia stellulata]
MRLPLDERDIRHTVTALIDGAPVRGGGIEIPVFYPATGNRVATLVEDDAADIDRAVAAARRAFDHGPWPHLSVEERQEYLCRFSEVIEQNIPLLAGLECLDTGKPIHDLLTRYLKRTAYCFRFFADYIGQSSGTVYDQVKGFRTVVAREPVGVAALLAPWNSPISLGAMKVAAALAFGNTCVLKPSEQTPMALVRLVELLHEAGLPEGAVNVVNGRGPVTGAALVAHQGVDLVSFTGGTETGRSIMAAAARNLVPCMTELGGKSANIVFASANLDDALDGALLAIYTNAGQQCLAGSRILVERPVFDDFVARFAERAERIRVGDPTDEATEMGPLATEAHMNHVLSYAELAREEGGRLVTGGLRDESLGSGYFVRPTAVVAPSNETRVAQEEIFGPFATFLPFEGVDEAAAIANGTDFGLMSYVWSDHLPTVNAVVPRLRSGGVMVNATMMRDLRAPFGGFKDSGVGREGGEASERFYTQEKFVSTRMVPGPLRRLGTV